MFDTTYELMGASVGEVEVEAGKEGLLELVFVPGITFPVAGPDGQPLRIPSGNIRFQLTREQALEYFKKGIDAAETLPKGAGIVIADEKQADQMAKTIKDIKSNG
jgi:hypothetical protein